MEDDLYGGLGKVAVVEGTLDSTLYEGLFAGPSVSGHHEAYLQNKVNELEDLLRERNAEVQALKSHLEDRDQKLLSATTERDILLRNISCLYNTAKEEMARKQGEINNLRAEVAQARQQQQVQPRITQRDTFSSLTPAAGADASRAPHQPFPGSAGAKRSRDADTQGDEQQQQQASVDAAKGSSGRLCSAADGVGAHKRPRCEEGPDARPSTGGSCWDSDGGTAVTDGFGRRALIGQPYRHRDSASGSALPPPPGCKSSSGGSGGGAARAASSDRDLCDVHARPPRARDNPDRGHADSSDRDDKRRSAAPGTTAGQRQGAAGCSDRGAPYTWGDSSGRPAHREYPHERCDGPGAGHSGEAARGNERYGGGDSRRDHGGQRDREGYGRADERKDVRGSSREGDRDRRCEHSRHDLRFAERP